MSKNITSVSDMIAKFLDDSPIGKKIKNYQVIEQWNEIVGDQISKISVPDKIENHVLRVKVNSSVWRHELSLRKKEIIDKINSTFKEEIVKDIIFR